MAALNWGHGSQKIILFQATCHTFPDTEVFCCGTAQPEVRYVHDTLYSGKVTRYLQVCLTCSRKWQNPDTFLAL